MATSCVGGTRTSFERQTVGEGRPAREHASPRRQRPPREPRRDRQAAAPTPPSPTRQAEGRSSGARGVKATGRMSGRSGPVEHESGANRYRISRDGTARASRPSSFHTPDATRRDITHTQRGGTSGAMGEVGRGSGGRCQKVLLGRPPPPALLPTSPPTRPRPPRRA